MLRNARSLGALAVSLLVLGSVLTAGGVVGTQLVGDADEPATQDTSYFRVAHASPDAPAVDVTVDDETVVTNLSFGEVGDYLTLSSGSYNVTVAANETGDVVYEDTIALDSRSVTTFAAAGQTGENASVPFSPILYDDNAYEPADNESAVSVVHLSPDAPAVDVTVGTGNDTTVLAENVSYGEASDYVTVPPGNYTIDVREAAPDNDGPVVATTDVALENGSAHSALAIGMLEADDSEPFQIVRTEDATVDVELPDTETPTPTITAPPVDNATETPGDNVTETPDENATETFGVDENETSTETESGTETATVTAVPSPTETAEPVETGDGGL
jgi:hypothetical protein